MRQLATQRAPWWAFFQRPAPKLRLFCFPFAGGTAQAYYGFANDLPAEIEPWCLQLPGHGWRMGEAPIRQMAPLIDALGPHLPTDVPFAFYGHSLGAGIMLSLAHWMSQRGLPAPVQFFLSGRRAHRLGPALSIFDLPDREFVRLLQEKYNGIPAALLNEPELLAMFLPVIRADLALSDLWQNPWTQPLPQAAIAFAGQQDAIASPAEMEPWRELFAGGFTLHTLPGDHFFIRTAQKTMLDIITRALLG